uniref:Uncharacterized protein n=1 Tax=viral metagenome TaxID=1070528 RepID=A0A6C0BMZ4_9ZZZZ
MQAYTPTFVLTKIDPHDVFRAYISGAFKDIVSPPSRLSMKKVMASTMSHGTDESSETFTTKDKMGITRTMITTGHKAYEAFMNDIDFIPDKCLWCRCKIPDDCEPIGIPIDSIQNKAFYCVLKAHCTFECMYATLMARSSMSSMYRDLYHSKSAYLANVMFKTVTGSDEDIVPAMDWILHEENGGPLSDDLFRCKSTRLKKTHSLVLPPVKTILERIIQKK